MKRYVLTTLLLATLAASGCEDFLDGLGSSGPQGIGWNSRFLYEDNLDWRSNRDMSSEVFGDYFDAYSDQGLMIIDVDVRTEGNSARYSMVWQENVDGRAWREHRNLTSEQYHDYWTQYRDQGYRPLDVEAYMLDGNLRFAGIWIENKEGLAWSSMRNLTSSEYADYFDEQKAGGLRPIDIEAYDTPDGLRFAAIWYENVDQVAWTQLRNIDRDRYDQEVEDHANAGYMMIDYESYDAGTEQLYAAIWEEKPDRPAYQIRTNRSQVGYANLWRTYRDMGYRIVDFENYNVDGGNPQYGGIWIENADRFRYDRKGQIDSIVDTYMQNNTIPGLSVAVIHRGDMIYRRGFGEADQETGKVAHSETVYGIASVSKVIGGTLAVKLEDEKSLRDGTTFSFDMGDPTSDYLTNIPSHHTHDVEQLTAHLGCVAHYSTTPAISNQTTHFNNAVAAAQSIWSTQLVNNCTIGQTRSYSTPAFTLLGAVLEKATDRTLVQLLDDELFDAYGLDSMRVQFASGTLPASYERAVPYDDNGNASTYGDNSWKVLGGGIETNVVDLARFGWLVLDGQIIDATTRDNRLWSPVDTSCSGPGGGTCRNGVGWELRTRNGRRVADHNGSWSGKRAWIRVYRDDDLVIAVASNMRGHNASNMIESIAGAVLAP